LWKGEDKSSVCCGWKLIRNIVLIAEREKRVTRLNRKRAAALQIHSIIKGIGQPLLSKERYRNYNIIFPVNCCSVYIKLQIES
jgi:hypothetical protein